MPDSAGLWLRPDWPLPEGVHAFVSLANGVDGDFGGFNLADHVGDDPERVAANRTALRQSLPGGPQLGWLQQVHGTDIATDESPVYKADGRVTRRTGFATVVMTADCLPILLCRLDGEAMAACHAGWRGLCHGVVVRCVEQIPGRAPLTAWLGPRLCQSHFEVGDEVRRAFVEQDQLPGREQLGDCFRAGSDPQHWYCDLGALARAQLEAMGVTVFDSQWCSRDDSGRFYSYRQRQQTGRNASGIFRLPA